MKKRDHKGGLEIIAVGSPIQLAQCYGKQDVINSAVHNFVFQSCVHTTGIPQRFVGCFLKKTT